MAPSLHFSHHDCFMSNPMWWSAELCHTYGGLPVRKTYEMHVLSKKFLI